jgi:hypothetical protein
MRNQPRNIRPTEALVDLLARRPVAWKWVAAA